MRHFYNQEGREDIKLVLEPRLLLFPIWSRNAIVNKMESAQKLREAELIDPHSRRLLINSNNDATTQSELLKSSNRYFLKFNQSFFIFGFVYYAGT